MLLQVVWGKPFWRYHKIWSTLCNDFVSDILLVEVMNLHKITFRFRYFVVKIMTKHKTKNHFPFQIFCSPLFYLQTSSPATDMVIHFNSNFLFKWGLRTEVRIRYFEMLKNYESLMRKASRRIVKPKFEVAQIKDSFI